VEKFTKSIENDPEGANMPEIEGDFENMSTQDQLYHLRGSLYVAYKQIIDLISWFGNSQLPLSASDFTEIGARLAMMQEIIQTNFCDFMEAENELNSEDPPEAEGADEQDA
jgi:hypothetical protein